MLNGHGDPYSEVLDESDCCERVLEIGKHQVEGRDRKLDPWAPMPQGQDHTSYPGLQCLESMP